jgi:hypothetical protein
MTALCQCSFRDRKGDLFGGKNLPPIGAELCWVLVTVKHSEA